MMNEETREQEQNTRPGSAPQDHSPTTSQEGTTQGAASHTSSPNQEETVHPAPFTAVGPDEEGVNALSQDALPVVASIGVKDSHDTIATSLVSEEPKDSDNNSDIESASEGSRSENQETAKRAPAATANSYRDIIAQRLAAKNKVPGEQKPSEQTEAKPMAHASSWENKPKVEAPQVTPEASQPSEPKEAVAAEEVALESPTLEAATRSMEAEPPVEARAESVEATEPAGNSARERARQRQRERAELRRAGRKPRPSGITPADAMEVPEEDQPEVLEVPEMPAPPTAPDRIEQPIQLQRKQREEGGRAETERTESARPEVGRPEAGRSEERRSQRPQQEHQERSQERQSERQLEQRQQRSGQREEARTEQREPRRERPEGGRPQRKEERPKREFPQRETAQREGSQRETSHREGAHREGAQRELSQRETPQLSTQRDAARETTRDSAEEQQATAVLASLKGGAPQQSQGDVQRAKTLASKLGISVVIPLYNEQESLRELTAALKAQLIKLCGSRYEIIYVNDGSTDRSGQILSDIIRSASRVTALTFRRNMGKSAGLAAGFKEAKYGIVITMDADLQDDPREIPNLVAKLEEGYDLVSGWKKKRYDPVTKTAPSKFFNNVTSFFAGIKLHDFNCGLKGYRKEVTDSLDVYGEMHRYLPALAHWRGFRVTEIPVVHHPRKFGKSKFGSSRFFKGFLDLLSIVFTNRFGKRPLHLFGTIGTVLAFAGFLIDLWVSIEWAFMSIPLSNRPILLLGVLLILVGVQLISLGLLGEMIVKNSARTIDVSIIKEKSTKTIDDRDRDRRRARLMRTQRPGMERGERGERRERRVKA